MKKLSFTLAAILFCLLISAATLAQPAAKTKKPGATFETMRVVRDIVEGGKKGMRIYVTFSVSGMKDVPAYLQIKFMKRDNTPLMDSNGAFDHEDGSVAAFGVLKPGFDPTLFKDYDVFMPYDELDLSPGTYQLRMDVDVILEAGDLVGHLELYDFDFTQPSKYVAPVKSTGGSATFQRFWVDYDITEGGKRRMRLHTAFKVMGMKGVGAYLQIKFQKRDGTPLMDKNGEFVHEDGSVAAFVKLRPGFDPAQFDDEPIFMPYSELDLTPGKHQLMMDVDVIYEDGGLVQHLTTYEFEYTKP